MKSSSNPYYLVPNEEKGNSLQFVFKDKYNSSVEIFKSSKDLTGVHSKCNGKTFKVKQVISEKGLNLGKSKILLYYDEENNIAYLTSYGLKGGGGGCSSAYFENNERFIPTIPIMNTESEFNATEWSYLLYHSVQCHNHQDSIAALNKLYEKEIKEGTEYQILLTLIQAMLNKLSQNHDDEVFLVRTCKLTQKYAQRVVAYQRNFMNEIVKYKILNPIEEMFIILDNNEKKRGVIKIIDNNQPQRDYKDRPLFEFYFQLSKLKYISNFILTDENENSGYYEPIFQIFKSIAVLGLSPIIRIGTPEFISSFKTIASIRSRNREHRKNIANYLECIKLDQICQEENWIAKFKDYIINNSTNDKWTLIYYALDLLCEKILREEASSTEINVNMDEIFSFLFNKDRFGKSSRNIYYKIMKCMSQIDTIFPNKNLKQTVIQYFDQRISKNSNVISFLRLLDEYIEKDKNWPEIRHSYEDLKLKNRETSRLIEDTQKIVSENNSFSQSILDQLQIYIEQFDQQTKKLDEMHINVKKNSELINNISEEISISQRLKEKSIKEIEIIKNIRELDYDCYIPPTGIINTNFEITPDLANLEEFEIESKINNYISQEYSTIVLTGFAGSGKTFLLTKILENLIQDNEKITIKIALGSISSIKVGLIEDYIIELGYSPKAVIHFRENFSNKTILLLDAYDEAYASGINGCSLISPKLLRDWVGLKTIVTCRCTDRIMIDKDYWKYFSEFKESIIEIRINSFNPGKRKELFYKYEGKYEMERQWDTFRLIEFISNNQWLSSINQTPFILKIMFRIIPKLNISKKENIDKILLLENFIHTFIDRGVDKYRKAGRKVEGFREKVLKYCRNFARTLASQNAEALKYKESDRRYENLDSLLNRSENDEIRSFFDSSPLIQSGEMTYEFLSIEIYEYFRAQAEIEDLCANGQSNNIEKTEIQEVNLHLIDLTSIKVSRTLIECLRKDISMRKKLIESLNPQMEISAIRKTIEILMGVYLVESEIGDQSKIDTNEKNSTGLSSCDEFKILCKNDGSVILQIESNEKILIEKNSEIFRSVICSKHGKFLVLYGDSKKIHLIRLKDYIISKRIIISEYANWLTAAKFSDDESKLFVALEGKDGNQVIIYDLENVNKHVINETSSIDDIILSPENADYFIIVKENLNFDYYHNNQILWSKKFNDKSIPFIEKIIQKTKLYAKCSSDITTKQNMFQKLDLLQKECFIQQKNIDEQTTRAEFTNLQGSFEQLINYYIQKGEIIEFFGVIHTEKPATPLITNINSPSITIIHAQNRKNIKHVMLVESRAKIINNLLKNPIVNFYAVFPSNNYSKLESGQMKIFEKNLKEFSNLQSVMINVQEDKFTDNMNGATYFFKHASEKWHLFSLKGVQIFSDENCVWRIWLGNVSSPSIRERMVNFSTYFSEKGWKEPEKLVHRILEENII